MDARRICKLIRKTEMSYEEINMIIEIMIKKEEQNQWVNTSSSKRQPSSILTKLKVSFELEYAQPTLLKLILPTFFCFPPPTE